MKGKALKKVFVIATQHLDVAWLWNRVPHGEDLMAQVFARTLELIDRNPEARFIMSRSTAWGFYIVEKKFPELFAGVQKAVAEGSIELSGGQWVEPDNAAPSGESFIRQSLYGQTYYYTRFGKTATVAWNPDVFMHGNTLPQLFARTGLEGYYFHRCRPVDADGNPIGQFIWEGPDGSQVYCFTGNWLGKPDERTVGDLCRRAAQTGLPADYIVTGLRSDRRITIDHDWLELPALQEDAYGLEECRWAGGGEMLARMKRYRDRLPVIKGDLGGYMFTGTYTSDQLTKRYNRRLENELAAAEFLNTWNLCEGNAYYYRLLTDAWQNLCVNQFHDILCGTCYRSAQEEGYALYREVEAKKILALESAGEDLDASLKTDDQEGVPWQVFNSLSTPYDGTVQIGPVSGAVTIRTSGGDAVACQLVRTRPGWRAVFVPPEPVPGCGASVFYVTEKDRHVVECDAELVLENGFVRVEFDEIYGTITSFFDKRLETEFFAAGSKNNRLVYHEDDNDYAHSTDHSWDPWLIGLTGGEYDPHGAYRVYVKESGPVFKTVRVERSLSITAGYPDTVINQEITLFRNSPLLHIRMSGDLQAEKVFVKSHFHFSYAADTVVCDMPYGVIARSSDYAVEKRAGEEAMEDRIMEGAQRNEPDRPMQMWIDFSDGNKGMAILNNGKYGYSSTADTLALSLMRAPTIKEHEVAGLGAFDFSFALLPHAGDWRRGNIAQAGYQFNREPIVRRTWAHPGDLVSGVSLFSVDDPAVVIASVKRAELIDGKTNLPGDIIVRLYETGGKKRKIRFTSVYAIVTVCEVNAIELEKTESRMSEISGNAVELEFGAFELKTLRLGLGTLNRP